MDIQKIVEATKEFFLEILGYLIPGLMLMICIYVSLPDKTKQGLAGSLLDNDMLIIIVGYVFGYVLYGIGMIRDQVMKKVKKILRIKNKVEEVEVNTTKKQAYLSSNEIIKELGTEFPSTLHDARSLVMSYITESDKKIYTFMFRAELCNHLGVVAGLVGSIALIDCLVGQIASKLLFIENGPLFICYYLLLIVSIYFLYQARVRFLGIALSIPFSIFVAKYRDKKN